uniref:Uncharacterized protein n=1 Tax=Faecalibaculum rodentium TaxID=1702221 RepID=A0A140DWS6_9FIRM|nr:hypothetical protein AALO17_19690 [Faecalibaculum rodentium]
MIQLHCRQPVLTGSLPMKKEASPLPFSSLRRRNAGMAGCVPADEPVIQEGT